MCKVSTTVFMGRMQPVPHNGHLTCMRKAIGLAAERVIIILGTANQAPTPDNPICDEDRIKLVTSIMQTLVDEVDSKVQVEVHLVEDNYYEPDVWINDVKTICNYGGTVAQVGCFKEVDTKEGHHLSAFPEWDLVKVDGLTNLLGYPVSSTSLRTSIYLGLNITSDWYTLLCNKSRRFLHRWIKSKQFLTMRDEFLYLKEYKDKWGEGPFNTADALVTHKGKVLLVKRKNIPGKGSFALPGGFVDEGELSINACLRELYEETGLSNVFEHLNRSKTFEREGRDSRNITTRVFRFELPDSFGIIGFTSSTETESVELVDKRDAIKLPLFADHNMILKHMLDCK